MHDLDFKNSVLIELQSSFLNKLQFSYSSLDKSKAPKITNSVEAITDGTIWENI